MSDAAEKAQPLVTEDGLYEISNEDYHRDDGICPEPSLSSSGARRLLATCPAKFWYERNHPKDPTPALKVGSAAHEYLLEHDTWPDRHLVLPEGCDFRFKEWRPWKEKKAEAEANGIRVIKHEEFQMIEAMAEGIQKSELASAAFKSGQHEQSAYWRDQRFGIWRRARFDFLPANGDILADYKTTLSLDDHKLERAVYDFGYHKQAAWYVDAAAACDGRKNPAMVYVFQEKEPPYLVKVKTLDPEAIEWGRIENDKACEVFARCLREDQWPSYPEVVSVLGLPGYAINRLEQAHAAGEFEIDAEQREQEPMTAYPY